MSEIIVDRAALNEPNLLLPFYAPINHVRLNPYWKYYNDLFYVYCSAVSPTLDLVSKIQGTQVGTFAPIADRTGINIQPTATSSYVLTNRGNPSGEPYNTILYVGVRPISSSTHRLFSTRRNSINTSWATGVFWNTSSTVIVMYYGDNTGGASTDYRSLQASNSHLSTRFPMSVCGCFKTSTTGSMYMNGISIGLSASGTGGAVAGTGNLTLYSHSGFTSSVWNPMYLLAIFNTQLPDPVMQSLSADPYQIFTAL